MDTAALLALYDQEQRIAIEPPGTRRELAPRIVRLIDLSGRQSCVIHSRLSGTEAEDVIQAEVEHFGTLGHDFEWKVFAHDTPADLKERLAIRGFEIDETETVMLLDLNGPSSARPLIGTHDVRRITSTDGLRDLVSLQEKVWGDDCSWLGERLARDLRDHPELLSVYVACVDGAVAASGWIYFTPASRFASLWGGSTLPEHRHRGLYRALLAARIHEARQRGLSYLTIDARSMSRPIVERFGFTVLTHATACLWKRTSRRTS